MPSERGGRRPPAADLRLPEGHLRVVAERFCHRALHRVVDLDSVEAEATLVGKVQECLSGRRPLYAADSYRPAVN